MCFNQNCNKNPLDNMDAIHVGDGDFVCNKQCLTAYEEQKAHFFNDICQSEEKTTQWLMSEIN